MTSQLSVQVSDGPDASIKVVALGGEMDENTLESLRSRVEPFLNNEEIKILILHLKNLIFINSKGIGYLVSVHTHMAKNHRKLVLVEGQEPVMDVVKLIGLTSIIPYYETMDGAREGLSA